MAGEARIGSELAGYRIEGSVGRGGMGVVYRAQHVHLQRTVAIKVLAPELAESQEFRNRFIRESRIAASIHHPNIVTVYDAGEADGALYIAMQYVEGTDLATVLRDEGALAPERALAVVGAVGSALDAAHERGLVHRDVKPANVLLDERGCYLTDFGLTKHLAGSTAYTETGQFVGTIDYIAPEQIEGAELDGRTDIYALGCVLYQCLTGRPPFERDSQVAKIYAHLQDPPPRASEQRPELPPALDDAIARGMAKRREDRPATCAELVGDATRALGGAPPTGVQAPSPTRTPAAPRPREPKRRRGRPAAWVAVGLAALAAAAVVALVAGGSGGGDGDGDGGRVVEPPARLGSGGKVTDTIDVGRRPFGVAVGEEAVWVTNFDEDSITQIDPGTSEVLRAAIPVGDGPFGVSVGNGGVWVANRNDGTVTRLDPETTRPLVPPIRVGKQPFGVAIGIGNRSVWIANGGDGTVTRIDVRTSEVVDEPIPVGRAPRGVATSAGVVWVTNSEDDSVTRIDSQTSQPLAPIEVGDDPNGVAVFAGIVWVANKGDGTVTRIDARTAKVVGDPIAVGGEPLGISAGEKAVWVTLSGSDRVIRLNPETGEPVGEVEAGDQPVAVRVGEQAVWVANNDSDDVTRIEP